MQSTRKHKWTFKEEPRQQDIDDKELLQNTTLKIATLGGRGIAAALTGLGLFAYSTYNNYQAVNSEALLLPNNLTLI